MEEDSASRSFGKGAARTSKKAKRTQYTALHDHLAYGAPLHQDPKWLGEERQSMESTRASTAGLEDTDAQASIVDDQAQRGNEISRLEHLADFQQGLANQLGPGNETMNTSTTQSLNGLKSNYIICPRPPSAQGYALGLRPTEGTAMCSKENHKSSLMDYNLPGTDTPARTSTASSNSDRNWGYISPHVPSLTPGGRPTRLAGELSRAEVPPGTRPERLEILDTGCSLSNGAKAGRSDRSTQNPTDKHALEPRPPAQNLRYGGFPAPQPPPNRNIPLGSGRLQNTNKLGNGASWGFGAPNGNLTNGPSRQPGATSFAQTIGGSQPAANLDPSEFPSLSGTSQPQYQNASQALWANQRAIQQTPVQRPQQPPQQQHAISSQASQQQQQNQQAQDQPHRTNDDIYSSTSHLQSALDDSRYQSALGQMPATRQPQTTNVDDFPPLGRNGTDDNDDRRGNLMQSSGYGGFSNSNAFSLPPDQAQARNALASGPGSQANNTRSPSVVDRLTSPITNGFGTTSNGRSPIELNRLGNAGNQDHDRNNMPGALLTQRSENNMNALLTNFTDSQYPGQQQPNQSSHAQQDYGNRLDDPAGVTHTPPDLTSPSQMSARDQWGLAGFLATISHDNSDVSGLARGHDLTSLGLNLNSSEALYPTFAGPFAEPGSRPLQPDFKLPECYTVDNVHRVRDKVPSFTDETLFWIFYTQPRDILQELAASELTNRNWRFHVGHRMWLTKDPTLNEPVSMGPEKEQGSYIFFNQTTWEKIRVSGFELHYKELAPTLSRPNGA